jgi:hypothetical protein
MCMNAPLGEAEVVDSFEQIGLSAPILSQEGVDVSFEVEQDLLVILKIDQMKFFQSHQCSNGGSYKC